jgi:hypothetical protein
MCTFVVAEIVRFELTDRLATVSGLAIRRDRPLCHISIVWYPSSDSNRESTVFETVRITD